MWVLRGRQRALRCATYVATRAREEHCGSSVLTTSVNDRAREGRTRGSRGVLPVACKGLCGSSGGDAACGCGVYTCVLAIWPGIFGLCALAVVWGWRLLPGRASAEAAQTRVPVQLVPQRPVRSVGGTGGSGAPFRRLVWAPPVKDSACLRCSRTARIGATVLRAFSPSVVSQKLRSTGRLVRGRSSLGHTDDS